LTSKTGIPGGLDLIGSANVALRSLYRDDEPWLNQSTACTYPHPWLSRVPPSLPALAVAANPPWSTLPPSVVPERPGVGWLMDAHRMYVGRYGHLLLGNFSVSFQPSQGTLDGGTLHFQVSHVISSFHRTARTEIK